ncbi:hypothetical protein [Pelomonas sp. KK5]|uniref:hypothetical protein n=1 Tax=Pelomonas sp. KK5 TaxID=1855730 RepID=UPI0011806C7B|nr:hypothetical protein [Pelomonas sp. KK5]
MESRDLKQQRIERLRGLIAAGAAKPSPKLAWNGENGSLSGALAQDKDAARFAELTGLPLELSQWAELLDGAVGRQAAAEFAAAQGLDGFYLRWLGALRPGADLGPVMPEIIGRQLAELAEWPELPPDAAVRRLSRDLALLWQRALGGDVADADEWRTRRKEAVGLSDSLDDAFAASLAEILSSVAWPPAQLEGEALAALQKLLSLRQTLATLPGMNAVQQAAARESAEQPRRFRRAAEAPGFDMMAWYLNQPKPEPAPGLEEPVDQAASLALLAAACRQVLALSALR